MEAIINDFIAIHGADLESLINYLCDCLGYAEEYVRSIIVEDLEI